MATDLELTELHDLRVDEGDLHLVSELRETRQSFRIRIWFWRGEWVYNQELGVPYFDYLLDVSTPQTEVDRVIRDVILKTEGVSEILEYKTWKDPVAKSALIYHRTRTVWGEDITERVEI